MSSEGFAWDRAGPRGPVRGQFSVKIRTRKFPRSVT